MGMELLSREEVLTNEQILTTSRLRHASLVVFTQLNIMGGVFLLW